MIIIDPRSSTPIYQQIVEGFKEKILRGIMEPGEKIPSVRELARIMTLNPNTVQKAYQELERQRVIVTIRGKGTFVSEDYIGKRDQEKMKELQDLFKKGIIEARYMGVYREELLKMIISIVDELEGD